MQPSTGWRASSIKVIVWFGDAPGHVPSNGVTSLAAAQAALISKGIKVRPRPLSGGGCMHASCWLTWRVFRTWRCKNHLDGQLAVNFGLPWPPTTCQRPPSAAPPNPAPLHPQVIALDCAALNYPNPTTQATTLASATGGYYGTVSTSSIASTIISSIANVAVTVKPVVTVSKLPQTF